MLTDAVTCLQRGAASRYRSYGDVFREIMRKDGVRGLYCGIVPEYAKARTISHCTVSLASAKSPQLLRMSSLQSLLELECMPDADMPFQCIDG